jgi:hypothetical protein
VIGYYMPSNVTTNYGFNSTNLNRAATNYYFLKNDDTVAQTQLGTLRSYNEFRYDTATSGSIAIDKNNAQVQYIAPTGNVTITGYSNMVTTLSDSVNNDQEIDTLTIIVQQGATPYTVTLPTGATYLYAGNVSSVPAVANSQSILTVVASNAAGTVNYFTTVSSDQPASAGSPGGSNTQIQFNNAGAFAGNVAMTFDNTTSNVTLSNVIIGTSGGGNAELGGNAQRINTSNAFSGTLATATGFQTGQMVIGNGYFGNLTLSQSSVSGLRGGKLIIWDSATLSDSSNVGLRYVNSAGQSQLIVGNVQPSNNTLIRAGAFNLAVGGGAGANSIAITTQGAALVAGLSGVVFVGQPNASVALGNVTLAGATGTTGQLVSYAGSSIGNGVAFYAQFNLAGNITNGTGMQIQFTGAGNGNTPSNVYGIHMLSNVSTGTGSFTNSNYMRKATNYYFLRNDDAVAQVQLGTLRSYNEYNYINATTSGALTIDKVNAQVQQVNLTGNISSITYANLVTSLSDSVNTDEEVDTVTIIFNQGTTGGYGVAFPSGSTYKYAGGVTALQSTAANSVTLVSVTATRISNVATYLTTISPGFV